MREALLELISDFQKCITNTVSLWSTKAPTKKKKQNCKVDKMIRLGYCAITDARTDWLTVETLFIANRLGIEIAEPAELSRKIRNVFIDQTERLAAMALDKNEITMGDVADAIRMHYTALPKGMFSDV